MQQIFTFQKLYKAYLGCRENKRKTINALKFEWDLEKNLFSLQNRLNKKNYEPGRSICFVVKEPCPREIFAANFEDRIVHHFLVNEIIEAGEKAFICDSFSCRKNKGTHLAVKRVRKFIRQITRNENEKAFYIKLDISGFFMSINHNILFDILKEMILKQNKSNLWKKDILWLAEKIIFHKPTKNYIIKGDTQLFNLIPQRKSLFHSPENKGLPIGNYSSQFFSNLYLNKLDQFIKRELKCKYYVRYVDDFIILSKNIKFLKIFENKIKLFLSENLNLNLNPRKTKIQKLEKGLDFLGYFIKLDHILVKNKVIKRFKERIYRINLSQSIKNLSKLLSFINSYYGHFGHANSFKFRKSAYKNQLKVCQSIFLPKNTIFSSLKMSKI